MGEVTEEEGGGTEEEDGSVGTFPKRVGAAVDFSSSDDESEDREGPEPIGGRRQWAGLDGDQGGELGQEFWNRSRSHKLGFSLRGPPKIAQTKTNSKTTKNMVRASDTFPVAYYKPAQHNDYSG